MECRIRKRCVSTTPNFYVIFFDTKYSFLCIPEVKSKEEILCLFHSREIKDSQVETLCNRRSSTMVKERGNLGIKILSEVFNFYIIFQISFFDQGTMQYFRKIDQQHAKNLVSHTFDIILSSIYIKEIFISNPNFIFKLCLVCSKVE